MHECYSIIAWSSSYSYNYFILSYSIASWCMATTYYAQWSYKHTFANTLGTLVDTQLAAIYYSYTLSYIWISSVKISSLPHCSFKHRSHLWNSIIATFPSYLVSPYRYIYIQLSAINPYIATLSSYIASYNCIQLYVCMYGQFTHLN